MSIKNESYYKLVKIPDLATLNRNTLVLIAGIISSYDENNKKIILDDGFGKHTIEVTESNQGKFSEGKVVKAFGRWDGIKITFEKILEWNILPDKLHILFLGL